MGLSKGESRYTQLWRKIFRFSKAHWTIKHKVR